MRGTPSNVLQRRINNLVSMEEERENVKPKFQNHKLLVKRWFDKHYAGKKDLKVGCLVLKWDKLNNTKGKHSKFQHLWLGPFPHFEKIGQGTHRLKSLQKQLERLLVNGQHLKDTFNGYMEVVRHY